MRFVRISKLVITKLFWWQARNTVTVSLTQDNTAYCLALVYKMSYAGCPQSLMLGGQRREVASVVLLNCRIDPGSNGNRIECLAYKLTPVLVLFSRAMMMTACDLSAIAKPWEVQSKVRRLIHNVLQYIETVCCLKPA